MFNYFGGKWRSAPHYPLPLHDIIIEPFAGAAGYSLRYYDRRIILNDIDPVIYGVWHYLIHAKSSEILALPLDIDDLRECSLPQEARWLLGFWYNAGAAQPRNIPASWMRLGLNPGSFWSERTRKKIAHQVEYIRHWKVTNHAFDRIEQQNCTWFVDPPYQVHGKHYKYSAVAYSDLSDWCRARAGQVIVCENEGAAWLPFENFRATKGSHGKHRTGVSHEVIYYKEQQNGTI